MYSLWSQVVRENICRICDGSGLVHWDGLSLVSTDMANVEAEECVACCRSALAIA